MLLPVRLSSRSYASARPLPPSLTGVIAFLRGQSRQQAPSSITDLVLELDAEAQSLCALELRHRAMMPHSSFVKNANDISIIRTNQTQRYAMQCFPCLAHTHSVVFKSSRFACRLERWGILKHVQIL